MLSNLDSRRILLCTQHLQNTSQIKLFWRHFEKRLGCYRQCVVWLTIHGLYNHQARARRLFGCHHTATATTTSNSNHNQQQQPPAATTSSNQQQRPRKACQQANTNVRNATKMFSCFSCRLSTCHALGFLPATTRCILAAMRSWTVCACNMCQNIKKLIKQ